MSAAHIVSAGASIVYHRGSQHTCRTAHVADIGFAVMCVCIDAFILLFYGTPLLGCAAIGLLLLALAFFTNTDASLPLTQQYTPAYVLDHSLWHCTAALAAFCCIVCARDGVV